MLLGEGYQEGMMKIRITSYNVCYTKLLRIGKGNLGFQFKSNWMTNQKTIPYKLNKMEWTADNSIEQNVKPMSQKITKFEFDGGIYFRW